MTVDLDNEFQLELVPSGQPDGLEYFPTDTRVTRLACQRLYSGTTRSRALFAGLDVLSLVDPCCGTGELLRDAAAYFPTAFSYGFELSPERAAMARSICPMPVVTADSLMLPSWGGGIGGVADGAGRPSLVITNPPFSLAVTFWEKAMAEVAPWGWVAFLLPVEYLEPTEEGSTRNGHVTLPRAPMLLEGSGLAAMTILRWRPFPKQTRACAWYFWHPGYVGPFAVEYAA